MALVERLVEADRSASIISVGIVAATAILASLAVPAMTIFALLRHERNQADEERRIYLASPNRYGRLPDEKWVVVDPDLGGRHGGGHPDRGRLELPHSARRGRRDLGPEVSGQDSPPR